MIRMYVLPLIAVLGVILAMYTVRASNPVMPATQPVALPAVSPYEKYVAGAGLVEASTENIAVGTIVPGIVKEIFVNVNQHVKEGDPLFMIDDRELQSRLRIQQAMLQSARQELSKLEQSPRAEDLPPLEARLQSAEASLANAQRELDRLQRIRDVGRTDELDRAKWDVATAVANRDAANAELSRMKAGAWKPDLEIARATVDTAAAQVEAVKVDLDRLIVRSPVDGTVMQVKLRKGEFASAGPLATPLMLIGNIDTLHLRVDIDENDAWRIQPNANATANVRGNRELNTQLKFVRIEPYIVPKRSLTGESNERVDTRVLQIVYAFDAAEFQKKNNVRLYAGQQMDVFIEVSAK
jgi:multidrug resistance efflux pump